MRDTNVHRFMRRTVIVYNSINRATRKETEDEGTKRRVEFVAG